MPFDSINVDLGISDIDSRQCNSSRGIITELSSVMIKKLFVVMKRECLNLRISIMRAKCGYSSLMYQHNLVQSMH